MPDYQPLSLLAMTDGDGLAIAMLATILLSFGIIVMLLACMIRNASKRDAGVDSLLDEMDQEEKSAKQVEAGSGVEKKESWEKDGDWWKG
jgi:acid phosphatase family membrane protein YuiD